MLDPFSYIAASRIKLFACPVVPLDKEFFNNCIHRLHQSQIIRLGDVSPDSRPDRVMYSPQGFPDGIISFDISVSDERVLCSEDFELYRRTLCVLGIAKNSSSLDQPELLTIKSELKSRYPQALVYKILVFDSDENILDEDNENKKISIEKYNESEEKYDKKNNGEIIYIPNEKNSTVTSVYTVMCDIASNILGELPLLAKAYSAVELSNSPMLAQSEFDSSPISSVASSPTTNGSVTTFHSTILTSSERQKQKSKGRVYKTLGDLYLLSGRVNDAIRQYQEAVSILRLAHDHQVHGAALEAASVCMVILSYLKVPFTISSTILASIYSDKGNDAKYFINTIQRSPTSATNNNSNNNNYLKINRDNHVALLRLLPDLTEKVLSLYSKASKFPEETVPPLIHAETIIRLTNLLAIVYKSGGLNDDALSLIVVGRPVSASYPFPPQYGYDRLLIIRWIDRVMYNLLDELDVYNYSKLLGEISTIYSTLGFIRKRNFCIKRLVSFLIPHLLNARVVNAAENGVHPSSGLGILGFKPDISISTSHHHHDLTELLIEIASFYGAPDNSTSNIGWPYLKSIFLSNAVSICEALLDTIGQLKFSIFLLKSCLNDLTKENQTHILSIIEKSLSTLSPDEISSLSINYWDNNIVDHMKIIKPENEENYDKNDVIRRIQVHNFSTSSNNTKPDSVFIYKPSDKPPAKPLKNFVVACGDRFTVEVILSNPFAFSVKVNSIAVHSNGPKVKWDPSSIVLSPASYSCLILTGTPLEPGTIEIDGCFINCFEFPVKLFKPLELVKTQKSLKIKPRGVQVNTPKNNSNMIKNKEMLRITSIPEQPSLSLLNTDSIKYQMLLEGETKSISLDVINSSPVDARIIVISFDDSTSEPLMEALNDKSLTANEIYEIEYFLLKRTAFEWIKNLSTITIPKFSNGKLVFNLFGKRGLNEGKIHIFYARLGDGDEEESNTVRRIDVSLTITVSLGVELCNCDIIHMSKLAFTTACKTLLWKCIVDESKVDYAEYFCVVFDFQNLWNSLMEIEIFSALDDSCKPFFSNTVTLLPSQTKRLYLPMKNISLSVDELHKDIPSLRHKQFVVDNSLEPEKLLEMKESFWLRETLLKRMYGKWKILDSQISGNIEMRGIRLKPFMISLIKEDHVFVSVKIDNDEKKQIKECDGTYKVPVDSYINLKVNIKNNSNSVLRGILRFIPGLKYTSNITSTGLDRRIACNGLYEKPIGNLKPGNSLELSYEIIINSKGFYKIIVSFEEYNSPIKYPQRVDSQPIFINAL